MPPMRLRRTHPALASHVPGKEVGSAARQHPTPGLSILTTHHKQFHPEWVKRTVLLPGWFEASRVPTSASGAACRGPGVCSARAGISTRWLPAPSIRPDVRVDAVSVQNESSRRVHVMIDFPWAVSPTGRRFFLKRMQMRIAIRAIDEIFALASPEEAERFSEALGVPRENFASSATTTRSACSEPPVSEGDYIFSGGSRRDYRTLVRAVAGTPYRTIICTLQTSYFHGMEIPANVEVVAVTHAGSTS